MRNGSDSIPFFDMFRQSLNFSNRPQEDMKNGNTTQNTLNDFLNPRSMLTPGIAGSVTMAITNALAAQFALPPNYTGLVISILFALVVYVSVSQHRWYERLLHLILNSLIIFSIALGTNQVGVTARHSAEFHPIKTPPMLAMINLKAPFFSNWMDGTVEKRKVLVSEVAKLNELQAEVVVTSVGLKPIHTESAKQTLFFAVTSARTAESIQRFEPAIEEASAKTMDKRQR